MLIFKYYKQLFRGTVVSNNKPIGGVEVIAVLLVGIQIRGELFVSVF